MSETAGIILSIVIISVIIWVAIACYISSKVDEVLNQFRNESKRFYQLAEGFFEVKTNGKKVKQWNKDHAIDYIINENAHEIILNLKLFNDLSVWWIHDMPNLKKSSFRNIDYLASNMLFIGGIFSRKATEQVNSLIAKYNPEVVKFRLVTYTYYEEGEGHYNPSTSSYTYSESSHKNITFYEEISPEEMHERIEFLAKYNFTITKHQYNCENQRSLMTKELRNKIIERDKHICQKCGKVCKYSEIEIDHIQPVSKGGKTIESNLQVLCVRCNRSKSNKWLDSLYNDISAYDDKDNNIKEFKKSAQPLTTPRESTTKETVNKKFQQNSSNSNNDIKWVSIISSNVKEAHYNAKLSNLYIKFKDSSIYVYYNVSTQTYIQFLSSPSKGRFVGSELRKYNYSRINESEVK